MESKGQEQGHKEVKADVKWKVPDPMTMRAKYEQCKYQKLQTWLKIVDRRKNKHAYLKQYGQSI